MTKAKKSSGGNEWVNFLWFEMIFGKTWYIGAPASNNGFFVPALFIYEVSWISSAAVLLHAHRDYLFEKLKLCTLGENCLKVFEENCFLSFFLLYCYDFFKNWQTKSMFETAYYLRMKNVSCENNCWNQ